MSGSGSRARSAWEDRYSRPTLDALLQACSKQAGGVLEYARERLLALGPMRESLEWRGLPWRWALSFHAAPDDRAFAYLVPNPAQASLAIPVPPEVVAELQTKRLSRVVRDGVTHAPTVSGVRWGSWEITSRAGVDEVIALAQLKWATLHASAPAR